MDEHATQPRQLRRMLRPPSLVATALHLEHRRVRTLGFPLTQHLEALANSTASVMNS